MPSAPAAPVTPVAPVAPAAPVAPFAPAGPVSPAAPLSDLTADGASLAFVIVLFLICLAVTVPGLIFLPLIRPEAAVAVPPITMKSTIAAMIVLGRRFPM